MKDQLVKLGFYSMFVAAIISGSCAGRNEKGYAVVFGDSLYLKDVPSQPDESKWKFVEDLKSPMWTRHDWEKREAGSDQADLSEGVTIKINFPDPHGRLMTAYSDLNSFLKAGNVSYTNGNYLIETVENGALNAEVFQLDIRAGNCRIFAGDIEGIRRGIFYLEDEMLRHRGPFLTLGKVEIKPVIQRRISRCFFGPIKRFPKMRDELMDDVNYYPEQYLNRLAHEGVNGLWLTIEFRDLVSTSFIPDAGKDSEKRLAKLRKTVETCLKYGIRTYIFCIEPRAWASDDPVIKKYPELAGAPNGRGYFFCPISQTAHKYLYESVYKIFRAVPDLGGMINISHGERGTTCLSALSCTSDYTEKINCPRCSHKEPWEILYASLSAMEKGMHDASPNAELISWLYMPQPQRYVKGDSYALGNWVYDLPAHTPEGVILQFNFESGVTRTEFGKLLVGGDYWISNPGPSDRFVRVANIAREHGTKVSAKIQTGNSHEVATVPYVPVPSLLYRKFSAMRSLGVTHSMLCWYFGNYPGLMNKAAGLLSMEPFPKDEETFMNNLASVYWKNEDVPDVVEAWKLFSEGYENYPLVNLFQYYGPMHDGPVWPLLLRPADAPLSPTWQIGSSTTRKPWPPSGDRVGECVGDVLTLGELVELTRRMTTSWGKGMEILNRLKNNYANEPDRLLDIGVAEALNIQFRSGYNILHFYLLREKMLRMEGKERLDLLSQMVEIIKDEINLDKKLLTLCENDSRLGFHSEAEGYKYFPAKIRWRMKLLEGVLADEVPEMRKAIMKNELLFPEYTGKKPEGAVADCISVDGPIWSEDTIALPPSLKWQSFTHGTEKSGMMWTSAYTENDLYIIVSEKRGEGAYSKMPPIDAIEIKIEPQRLYPAIHFEFRPDYEDINADPVHIRGYPLIFRTGLRMINEKGTWKFAARIPLKNIKVDPESPNPIRIDVIVHKKTGTCSWRPNNKVTPRLILGSDNPADLGWLVFL